MKPVSDSDQSDVPDESTPTNILKAGSSEQVTETDQGHQTTQLRSYPDADSEIGVIDGRENCAGDFVIREELAIEANAESHRRENELKDTPTNVREGQFSTVTVIFVEY